jgi:hypothetical protein
MSKPRYRVGKVPLRYVPQRTYEDHDLRCIDRALARLDVTRHLDRSHLSRVEIKAWLACHTYARVAPFWRIQLDHFLELLPKFWDSLNDEWHAFLQYAVPRGQPPARTSLRLVVNNKPKPPAPKTTPRWRPDPHGGTDDGPQAA